MKIPEKTRSKNRSRNLCEKVRMGGKGAHAASPQEHLQFNKIPTEGTYINKINTKRRYPTCKKPTEGDNNLQKSTTQMTNRRESTKENHEKMTY